MKKVNLIGKKITSLGLVASLLLTSFSSISCYAEKPNKTTQTQQGNQNIKTIKEKFTSEKVDNTVNVNVNLNTTHPLQPAQKNEPLNQKQKNINRVFKIGELVLISTFLIYATYKNSQDIAKFGKEFSEFISENKEIFKGIANGGFVAIKSILNSTKFAANFILKALKFTYEHSEATKNVLATVGSYNIYKLLKNKIKNLKIFC